MTALRDILVAQIAASGPIRLADYMAACLMHPQHGYYVSRQPFGTAGDFTTAPEISQMFGEFLGLTLAQYWIDLGRPPRIVLAELGPGRGTLMADILRATRAVSGFHTALQIWLVEASLPLRDVQKDTLKGFDPQFAASPNDLPDGPLFLLANEFFDALPIRQFTRHANGWAETVVGLQDGQLCLGKSAPAALDLLAHRLADTEIGEIVEVCPLAAPLMAGISGRIAQHGGLALIVDYGGWRSRRDTFQAVRNHSFADPMQDQGLQDLTAHVDFEALANAATEAGAAIAYTSQGALLSRLGLHTRAAQLGQKLTGAALEAHLVATRRLTDPQEMGELFKALAVFPKGAPLPAGFGDA